MSILGLWLVLTRATPEGELAPSARGDAPLVVQWSGPSACGDARELVRHLERLGITAPEATLRVTFTDHFTDQERARGVARWSLDLTLDTASGRVERSVRAAECALLVDAAAVITAVALDPIAVAVEIAAQPRLPRSTPMPTRSPVPAANDDEPAPSRASSPPLPPPLPPARKRRAVLASIGARAIVGRGLVPRIDAGAEVQLALTIARARIEVTTWVIAPQPARLDDRPDAGADVGLVAVSTRGCLVLGPVRVQFEACTGIVLGGAFARAIGVERSRPGRSLWVGLEAGPRVVWRPRPRFGIRVGVDGVAGLRRPAFAIADRSAPIHRFG